MEQPLLHDQLREIPFNMGQINGFVSLLEASGTQVTMAHVETLYRCPPYASLVAFVGIFTCLALSCFGACVGTYLSARGIMEAAVTKPNNMMRNLIAPILAQVLGIYGLVVSVICAGKVTSKMSLNAASTVFGAGLAAGLCCLASGIAIGVVGDAGVRAANITPRVFVGMVIICIFGEVLGLYGLIIGLMVSSNAADGVECVF